MDVATVHALITLYWLGKIWTTIVHKLHTTLPKMTSYSDIVLYDVILLISASHVKFVVAAGHVLRILVVSL